MKFAHTITSHSPAQGGYVLVSVFAIEPSVAVFASRLGRNDESPYPGEASA